MNIKVYSFIRKIDPHENNIDDSLKQFQSLNQAEMDNLDAGIPSGVNYKRITLITDLEEGS